MNDETKRFINQQKDTWSMPQKLLIMDDLPSERFLIFYATFEHYALLIATISFLGTTFVIVKASTKSMGKYKWFLLHEIVWSYIFDICICLWAIVPLFPYQCGYSIGLMRYTNPYAMQMVVKFVIACGVGKGFSLFIAMLHRNIQALPESSFKRRYQKSGRLHWIFLGMWILVEIPIVGPLFFADIGDQSAIKQFFSSQDTTMKSVYDKEPSTVCYVLDEKTTAIYAAIGFFATSAILTIPLLMANMFYWVMKSRGTVTRSTFRIQWMLFISICVQVVCAFVCLVVPLYMGLAFDLLNLPKAPIVVCVLLCLACLHSTLDCLVLVVFVAPYRRFVFGSVLRLAGLEDSERKTSIFVTATSVADRETKFNSVIFRKSIF